MANNMIEECLSEINAEYYKTAEYKNWLANLDSECKYSNTCWQEYCWQCLHADDYMFLHRSRKDAICYLLQDPAGNVLCDRYERYIDMCLYMSFKAKREQQIYYLKVLPMGDALNVLRANYLGVGGYNRMEMLIQRYCQSEQKREGAGEKDSRLIRALPVIKNGLIEAGICKEVDGKCRWLLHAKEFGFLGKQIMLIFYPEKCSNKNRIQVQWRKFKNEFTYDFNIKQCSNRNSELADIDDATKRAIERIVSGSIPRVG